MRRVRARIAAIFLAIDASKKRTKVVLLTRNIDCDVMEISRSNKKDVKKQKREIKKC